MSSASQLQAGPVCLHQQVMGKSRPRTNSKRLEGYTKPIPCPVLHFMILLRVVGKERGKRGGRGRKDTAIQNRKQGNPFALYCRPIQPKLKGENEGLISLLYEKYNKSLTADVHPFMGDLDSPGFPD